MRRLARAYPALVRAHWARALEYRAQLVLWLLSGIFPLVMMAVWLAVVAEAGPLQGWDQADFAAYYVAAALTDQLTSAWVLWKWDEDIRLGDLSIKLVKPLDPFHPMLSEILGWKILAVLFFLPVVMVATAVSPVLNYSLSLGRVLAYVAAVIGGLGVALMMGTAFAMIAFWSTQSRNLYGLVLGVGQFLSGWIAPLALFPAGLRQVAHFLPFRSAIGFPVEVLLGQVQGPDVWLGFTVTAAWIIFFWLIYRVLWRLGLRRYEAVGA